jgi:hypothetical protein
MVDHWWFWVALIGVCFLIGFVARALADRWS